MLLAVIPAFGLVFYGNLEQRRIEKLRVREDATAIARLGAATQQNFIEDARQLVDSSGLQVQAAAENSTISLRATADSINSARVGVAGSGQFAA